MIFYYQNLSIINVVLAYTFFRSSGFKIVKDKHVLGRPAVLEDENNPDWVPCQNLGYKFGCALKRKSDLDRLERLKRRVCDTRCVIYFVVKVRQTNQTYQLISSSNVDRCLFLLYKCMYF